MAALSNPVSNVNIVSRFDDYVRATAQSGIVWGTNAIPVYSPGTPQAVTVIPSASMGGPTTGDPSPTRLIDPGVITASTIYSRLNTYTQNYCYIRKIRGIVQVTGLGGNAGSRPTAGNVYDVTNVTFFSDNTKSNAPAAYAGPTAGVVAAGQIISSVELENFLARCRTAYNNFARNQTLTYTTQVCHASCHSSCHGSRGRR